MEAVGYACFHSKETIKSEHSIQTHPKIEGGKKKVVGAKFKIWGGVVHEWNKAWVA